MDSSNIPPSGSPVSSGTASGGSDFSPRSVSGTIRHTPQNIQSLPAGTILTGDVTGKTPEGEYTVRTDRGTIAIATRQDLPTGTNVTLEIKTTGQYTNVLLLAAKNADGEPIQLGQSPKPQDPAGKSNSQISGQSNTQTSPQASSTSQRPVQDALNVRSRIINQPSSATPRAPTAPNTPAPVPLSNGQTFPVTVTTLEAALTNQTNLSPSKADYKPDPIFRGIVSTNKGAVVNTPLSPQLIADIESTLSNSSQTSTQTNAPKTTAPKTTAPATPNPTPNPTTNASSSLAPPSQTPASSSTTFNTDLIRLTQGVNQGTNQRAPQPTTPSPTTTLPPNTSPTSAPTLYPNQPVTFTVEQIFSSVTEAQDFIQKLPVAKNTPTAPPSQTALFIARVVAVTDAQEPIISLPQTTPPSSSAPPTPSTPPAPLTVKLPPLTNPPQVGQSVVARVDVTAASTSISSPQPPTQTSVQPALAPTTPSPSPALVPPTIHTPTSALQSSVSTLTLPQPVVFTQEWPALKETMEAIAQTNTQTAVPAPTLAATTAQHIVPQTGQNLGGTLLFFVSALFGDQKAATLLNPSAQQALAVTDGEPLPPIVQRFEDDLQTLQRLARFEPGAPPPADNRPTDWRSLHLPFYDGGQYTPINMYYRQEQHLNEVELPEDYTRMVIDLDLTKLGKMRLDGIFNTKAFVLNLNTDKQLPIDNRNDLKTLFADYAQAAGFAGQLNISQLNVSAA